MSVEYHWNGMAGNNILEKLESKNKFTAFLYDLMRDYLPCHSVQGLVNNAQHDGFKFTNGHLAKYAEQLANQLIEE